MQQHDQYPKHDPRWSYNEWQNNQQQPYPKWIYAFMPSYSAQAFLAFLLYFCGYFPGLLVNIILLLKALDTKEQFGRSPNGLGFLVVLLILFTVGPVVLFFVMSFFMLNWTRF